MDVALVRFIAALRQAGLPVSSIMRTYRGSVVVIPSHHVLLSSHVQSSQGQDA